MRINNKTGWSTPSLRAVFVKVLAEWNRRHKSEPKRLVQSKHLKVRMVHCRSWSGNSAFSGCAWIGGRTMTLRVPNPRPRTSYGTKLKAWDGEMDVLNLAFLFEHELAHCSGYHHKQMGFLNKWSTAHSGRYDYVKDLKVERAKPKAEKPKPDPKEVRYKRAQAALKRWQTKAKRAETAIRKYRATVRRYEKVLGAERLETFN